MELREIQNYQKGIRLLIRKLQFPRLGLRPLLGNRLAGRIPNEIGNIITPKSWFWKIICLQEIYRKASYFCAVRGS
ncbi:hypothetical protein CASFOL_002188 [Castilleja foliolosa]|uniref:Uncharacterized protein n=1 Tax=Castilleja foliolosa TaxID=1961234 RepID=A0ABD3EFH0_9LAMI